MIAALVIAVGLATATPFSHDHAALAQVLDGAVSPVGVDYGLLASRQPQLDAYLAQLATAPIDTFSKDEQLAFWINAYNAYTLHVVLTNQPLVSIRDLDGGDVWKRRSTTIAGQTVTLDDIEHRRVRPLGDGRIHAAVNCASKGCPPLPPAPIVASKLDAQLDEATRVWASTNAFALADGALRLSSIFDWYSEDFVRYARPEDSAGSEKARAAVGFLSKFVDSTTAASLRAALPAADWADYDWALNAR